MELLNRGLKVLKELKDAGFQAFIVGGAVRDFNLGLIPQDIDICSDALPEEVMKLFPKHFPSGIEFGTITIFFEGDEFEITTFRTDGEYIDGRKPEEVLFTKDLSKDLERRDFTINSLAMDSEMNTIDLFGGLLDLKKGVVKSVGIASDRFNEDALRIMRAFRFSARFGFDIEEETLLAILETKTKLGLISGERVRDELIKILKTDNVNKIMHEMYDVGVFDVILRDLTLLFGVEQNHPNHIFNLSTHTFKSVENIRDENNLKVVMLLHDIGKSETKEEKDGKDTFHGHNLVSCEIAERLLNELRFSNKDILEILELVKLHDRDVALNSKSIRRLVNQLKYTTLDMLISVKRADILAQNKEFINRLEDLDTILKLAKEESIKKINVADLSVNGHDMMGLGLKGDKIGKTLSHLLDLIIDEPEQNNKDNLICIARSFNN